MKLESSALNRILKNALLSLFIFALPIVLMFLTFYITGDRPWEKDTSKKQEKVQQSDKTNKDQSAT